MLQNTTNCGHRRRERSHSAPLTHLRLRTYSRQHVCVVWSDHDTDCELYAHGAAPIQKAGSKLDGDFRGYTRTMSSKTPENITLITVDVFRVAI
jgi:hypothetical protein